MWPPPLFASRPPGVQFLLAGVVPAVGGAVGGILLGVSEPLYLIYVVGALAAGYLGGYEHTDVRAGLVRGLVAGALFGVFILVAHAISGAEAKAELPHPEALLLVLTVVPGIVVAGLGARARGRRETAAQAS